MEGIQGVQQVVDGDDLKRVGLDQVLQGAAGLGLGLGLYIIRVSVWVWVRVRA